MPFLKMNTNLKFYMHCVFFKFEYQNIYKYTILEILTFQIIKLFLCLLYKIMHIIISYLSI